MFTIIGGNPFTGYTGTTTFTSLSVIASTESFEEMEAIVKREWEACAGLMLVLYNGQEIEYDSDGKFIRP